MFKQVLASIALTLPLVAADPTAVEELLRQGLYQEEANRNFDQAAEHYRAVIAQHDRQRSLAATATYRLGEIARKKGDKAAATEAFLAVITRFTEQEDLVRLSRENLTALGTAVPAAGPGPAAGAVPIADESGAAEISRLQQLARSSPDLLDGADTTGWRPLHHAASKGLVKVISYLLENRADPNGRTNREQITPLQLASAHGHLEAVKTLLAAKAAIQDTVRFGDAKIALPTLDTRASSLGTLAISLPTPILTAEVSALDLAVLFDRREVARALIAGGADIKEPRLQFGLSFTSRDAQRGLRARQPQPGQQPTLPGAARPSLVQNQLIFGTDVRTLIESGEYRLSPLLAAICLQQDALVSELLKAKAPLVLSGPGAAPDALMLATAFNPGLVPVLLKAGADPKVAMPETGVTALHIAAEAGFVKTAEQLIEAGANPKALDASDRPPLHFANGAAVVDLLISKGADLNARDTQGFTAFDYATCRERDASPATFSALLKAGATVDNPIAVLNRAVPICNAALREPMLRERIYPKSARADGVLLAIHHASSYRAMTAVGMMEIQPAPGSPPPSLTDGLWLYCQGNFSSGSATVVVSLTILRRDAAGRFVPRFAWTPKPGERETPAWPALEWGDVVEIILNYGGSDVLFGDHAPAPEERLVTVRFGGMEFQRRISEREIWLGTDESLRRAVEWSPWGLNQGTNVRAPRRAVPAPPGAMFNLSLVEMLGFPPDFADVAQISVIRKGIEKPIAVAWTAKDSVPLRLLPGDVIELLPTASASKTLEERQNAWFFRSDLSAGGMIETSYRSWCDASIRAWQVQGSSRVADWSKLQIRRAATGKVDSFDLTKILAGLPEMKDRTQELLTEALPQLKPGDMMVLPFLPENADEAAVQQSDATLEIIRNMTGSRNPSRGQGGPLPPNP